MTPSPPTILLFSRSTSRRQLLHEALRSQGYEVESASTGQEAATALAARAVDLLVADCPYAAIVDDTVGKSSLCPDDGMLVLCLSEQGRDTNPPQGPATLAPAGSATPTPGQVVAAVRAILGHGTAGVGADQSPV